jgi:Reverse transcriptase (RNA-dependent DNA polymerase)
MNWPKYKNKPIGSLEALSRGLGITLNELLKLSENADRYYISMKPIIKPNGKERQTFDTRPFLKRVHNRILHQIFYKVCYPNYLQGSIKDKENPRDYITNCMKHTSQRVIFSEDISNFFPSIKSEYVFKMWKFFFNFPDCVADTLTKLTTYKGFVPQGAKTSSYIANLIIWETEPKLEEELRKRGFVYTRYVDDITVSTSRYVSNDDKEFVTSMVYKMLLSIGVIPNRGKRSIVTSSKRMTIHNVNVNSRKPTLSRNERNNIRALVKQCEIIAEHDRFSESYRKLYNSTSGRVSKMSRLHEVAAKKYRERLRQIRPLLG